MTVETETIAALRSELLEQCRLLGKSASREDKLLKELAETRRELAKKEAELKEAWAKNGKSLDAWMREKANADKYKSLAGKLAEALKAVREHIRLQFEYGELGTLNGHPVEFFLEEALKLWREVKGR